MNPLKAALAWFHEDCAKPLEEYFDGLETRIRALEAKVGFGVGAPVAAPQGVVTPAIPETTGDASPPVGGVPVESSPTATPLDAAHPAVVETPTATITLSSGNSGDGNAPQVG